jgi:hypothetical protein
MTVHNYFANCTKGLSRFSAAHGQDSGSNPSIILAYGPNKIDLYSEHWLLPESTTLFGMYQKYPFLKIMSFVMGDFWNFLIIF